jgi:hypothetical protein
MDRRERQQLQIAAALDRRHYARVLVLAREHLAEYPDDDVVKAAAAIAHDAWEGPSASDRRAHGRGQGS